MPHITFIHGINNKPPVDDLFRVWEDALAENEGINLGARGVTSSFVYWADVLYSEPAPIGQGYESMGEADVPAGDVDSLEWMEEVGPDEARFIDGLEKHLRRSMPTIPDEPRARCAGRSRTRARLAAVVPEEAHYRRRGARCPPLPVQRDALAATGGCL